MDGRSELTLLSDVLRGSCDAGDRGCAQVAVWVSRLLQVSYQEFAIAARTDASWYDAAVPTSVIDKALGPLSSVAKPAWIHRVAAKTFKALLDDASASVGGIYRFTGIISGRTAALISVEFES